MFLAYIWAKKKICFIVKCGFKKNFWRIFTCIYFFFSTCKGKIWLLCPKQFCPKRRWGFSFFFNQILRWSNNSWRLLSKVFCQCKKVFLFDNKNRLSTGDKKKASFWEKPKCWLRLSQKRNCKCFIFFFLALIEIFEQMFFSQFSVFSLSFFSDNISIFWIIFL